jgi:uncharacterized repeat protein (TIGR01451 family)
VISWIRRRRRQAAALTLVGLVALAGTAGASHLANDTQGHSTFEQTLVPAEDPVDGYTDLELGPAEDEYILRDAGEDPALPAAQPNRADDRESLTYFSQLTDFQLADEESPVRVEFADPAASSAWRPQEGFTAFQMEATIRQINEFADASPVADGEGSFRAMDFALLTGDQADNQQLNETRWVRDLLEGTDAPINFNSGLTDPADYEPDDLPGLGASCAAFVTQEGVEAGATTPEEAAVAAAAEGARYTGVQDYDDYPAPPVTPLYYDPDEPQGDYADWPEYDGLMDRAQQLAFTPEGLDVPFYVTNGNHDVLVQGNEDANAAFEEIATGCFKALGTTNAPQQPGPPDPNALLSPAGAGMLIPPDPDRRFVSKPQIKEVYGASDEGPADDDHGFAYVDEAENDASNGSASYYAWNPPQTPRLRFISIDTNSEGGQTAEGVAPGSSNGNIDDPQFQWLKRELEAADEQDQLVVIFGHHPVRSMNAEIRDEQAAPCIGGDDGHGHDPNPGCDLDPRPSDDDPATPGVGCIHNGTDEQNSTCPGGDAQHESFEELIDESSTVLAYVPGHTHEHRLTPFVRSDGTTWWEVNTSAVVDHPNQSRLVEIMDNNDGTMSIFNTVVDHASPATAPPAGPAAGFTEPMLASLGRTFSYNDPDNNQSGTGAPEDRNAELLLEDPRPDTDLSIAKSADATTLTAGEPLTYTLTATNEGGIEALETVVTDELPSGYDVTSTEASQGSCSQSGQTVTCELGALAGGESATVTIEGTPNEAGEISNTAEVSGNVTDSDPSNDSATVATTVLPGPGKCGGKTATIEAGPGAGIIRGTPGKDVIAGSEGDDKIIGGGGNDLICGGGGDDQLKGKGGRDKLRGGGGKDKLRGGAKDDRLKGGGGPDVLRGGSGEDRCNGGKGRDTTPENDCEKRSGI